MPRLLIDTQVLLWWLSDDTRLGPGAAGRLARDPVLVSVASLWEIAIKADRAIAPSMEFRDGGQMPT
jgi:PIN domain nuclease of toxin-antitoxin system